MSSVVLAEEAGDDRGDVVSQVPECLITEAKGWAKGDQLLEQEQQKRRERQRESDRGRQTAGQRSRKRERKEEMGGGQGPLFKWELSKCTQEVLLVVALRTYPV